MIEQGEGTQAQKDRQRENLRLMVSYCENKHDCRRSQILDYFGEQFDAKDCHKTCDNCRDAHHRGAKVEEDVTGDVIKAIKMIRDAPKDSMTLTIAMDVFKGRKNKILSEKNLLSNAYHGVGSHFGKQDLERLFRKLVTDMIFKEQPVRNFAGFFNTYVRLGSKANDVLAGKSKVLLELSGKDTYPDNDESPRLPPLELNNASRGAMTFVPPNPPQSSKATTQSSKPTASDNKGCYDALIAMRDQMMQESGLKQTKDVFTNTVLKQMSQNPPQTSIDLLGFASVGTSLLLMTTQWCVIVERVCIDKVKFDRFGERILGITRRYKAPADVPSSTSSSYQRSTTSSSASNNTGRGRSSSRGSRGGTSRGGGSSKGKSKGPLQTASGIKAAASHF